LFRPKKKKKKKEKKSLTKYFFGSATALISMVQGESKIMKISGERKDTVV
jgi:hypothetical protein